MCIVLNGMDVSCFFLVCLKLLLVLFCFFCTEKIVDMFVVFVCWNAGRRKLVDGCPKR